MDFETLMQEMEAKGHAPLPNKWNSEKDSAQSTDYKTRNEKQRLVLKCHFLNVMLCYCNNEWCNELP